MPTPSPPVAVSRLGAPPHLRWQKVTVCQHVEVGSRSQRLFPHPDASLVAQVQEALVLRVVRTTDEVGANLLEERHIPSHLQARGDATNEVKAYE
jgi:hypothetical protein